MELTLQHCWSCAGPFSFLKVRPTAGPLYQALVSRCYRPSLVSRREIAKCVSFLPRDGLS